MKRHFVLAILLSVTLGLCNLASAGSAGFSANLEGTLTRVSTQQLNSVSVDDTSLTLTPQPMPTCWPGDKRCWPEKSELEVANNISPMPTCWPGDKRCWPERDAA